MLTTERVASSTQYDVIMAADCADDIPVGTQEWLDHGTVIRSFTVQRITYPNVVVVQFQDGSTEYFLFDDFKAAVEAA